jgi:hypothetical protein
MSDKRIALIEALVNTFTTECVSEGLSDGAFFLNAKYDAQARHFGDVFWLPLDRAYTAFCYTYSALFGIPAFTAEALACQPDRFSQKRLPLTIRSTSGFILDGFGYDRRTERHRRDIYWPGPVIRSVHAHNPKQDKNASPIWQWPIFVTILSEQSSGSHPTKKKTILHAYAMIITCLWATSSAQPVIPFHITVTRQKAFRGK